MTEVIQINLNHCYVAQQLLWQTVSELGIDVGIVSDPYSIPAGNGRWIANGSRKVAIWTTGRYPAQEVVSTSEDGYVIAKVNGIYFCSCYFPPSWNIDYFSRVADTLAGEMVGRNPAVIAGDFNAWATDWGSRSTNPKGQALLEAIAKLNVEVANRGSVSTYRMAGQVGGRQSSESIVDVTFCSPGLLGNTNWRVDEGFTNSDHQAIRYKITYQNPTSSTGPRQSIRRWMISRFDREIFVEMLRREYTSQPLNGDQLSTVLARACDGTMPRQSQPRNARRPVYWWNDTIASLRAACLRARRRWQRAREETARAERHSVLREAKAELRRAIKRSRRDCFRDLCRNANTNPWGDAYRIVMAKTKGPAVPIDRSPETMKKIVNGLFPRHSVDGWPPTPYVVDVPAGESTITNDELITIAKSLKLNKAPGPDGIPSLALRIAILENPDMFRETLQRCINEGTFPDCWKRQQLVLLPKPGKDPGDPSAYRPICLLDTLGKLLERVILNRLVKYTEGESGLSDKQYGF